MLWVSLNLVLPQQQQRAAMALGWVDICATEIRSVLNLLPFASASCACLLRAPKRRPPVEVRDVRELRDFAYRLVHPGGAVPLRWAWAGGGTRSYVNVG